MPERLHKLVHPLFTPPEAQEHQESGTVGTTSAMCSTVRSWTRSCGPRGSARQAGRNPHTASSSSYSWKNAWGGGSLPELRRILHLVNLSPSPGPWPSSVPVGLSGESYVARGRSDRLLLVSPPRAQSSLPPTLSSAQHGLPARIHRERCHKTRELLG